METREIFDLIVEAARKSTTTEPFEDALALMPRFIEEDMFAEREYARTLRDIASEKVIERCTAGDMDTAGFGAVVF